MEVRIIENTPPIVWADGEIDLSNADLLRDALEETAGKHPQGVVVDLSDTTYLDSAGVQAVLRAYRLLTAGGGKIALVITKQPVQEIFTIISANQLPGLFICSSLETAREAVTGKG